MLTTRLATAATLLAMVLVGNAPGQMAGHEGFYGAIDRARVGAVGVTGKDTGLPLGTVQTVPEDEACRAKLAEAVKLAGQGKRAEAEAAYAAISAQWPEQGFAAEGRYLKLTGEKEAREAFVARLEAQRGKISNLALARGYAGLGEPAKALEVLMADPATASGTNIGQAVLAAGLLRDANRDAEREQLLLKALLACPTPEGRSLLFEKLMASHPELVFAKADDLIAALQAGVPMNDPAAVRASNLMQEAALQYIGQEDYFKRRDEFLAKAKTAGGAAAWFATRLIVREERHADALEYIDPVEKRLRGKPDWALVAQEKAELLRTLKRFPESEAIQKTLAEGAVEPFASRLKFDLSRTALAEKKDEVALKYMNDVHPESLDEVSRQAFYMSYLLATARSGTLDALADAYAKYAPSVREDDLDFIHEQIFLAVSATERHTGLEDLIRKRFEADPKTEPMLWILASQAAHQARKAPNELEALFQYTKLKPHDYAGMERLANAVAPIAGELIKAPKEALAVPQVEIDKLALLADESLRILIQARPYAPENYKLLMELRKAQGKDPVEVPMEAVKDSQDPKLIENAGFVLATGGYPQESLKLYDRALELDPKFTKARLNRASALTRLSRWDEASEFYWKLLEEGEEGHKYHVHELVMRLFDISVETKKEAEFLTRYNALLERWDKPWKYESMGDAATLLSRREKLDDSEKLFRRLATTAPEPAIRQKAWRELTYALINANKPERGLTAIEDAEKAMADSEEAVLEFQQIHVDLLAQLEKRPEAIAMLRRMIDHFPKTEITMLFPFRLAELAEEEGDNVTAKKGYEEFLASPSRDFSRRIEAKARLEQLASAKAAPKKEKRGS